jgi:hypothetical protein
MAKETYLGRDTQQGCQNPGINILAREVVDLYFMCVACEDKATVRYCVAMDTATTSYQAIVVLRVTRTYRIGRDLWQCSLAL